jgi:uncharacterized protein YabN with tetrapyrrole methylase and pyrophosphatase domain
LKFEKRFRKLEKLVYEEGMQINEMSPNQLDDLWQKVKEQEKSAESHHF